MMRILFADEHVLAVEKPAGVASIPGRGPNKDSLLTRLHQDFGRLYVVHRLDTEVSGVILFARNPDAHRELNDQFAARTVKKTYEAIIHGILRQNAGRIDRPIREFGSGRMGVDDTRGKPSVTEYEVLDRFDAFTRVTAQPLTGRRHQIRVHFYSIGHPIVGDRRYGDKEMQATFPRLMLHSQSIAFLHPSGQRMAIESQISDGLLHEFS